MDARNQQQKTSNFHDIDALRGSQLDFVAPKTCAIGGEPMLTAGWKEYRSGARVPE